jgi:hypothetical protein
VGVGNEPEVFSAKGFESLLINFFHLHRTFKTNGLGRDCARMADSQTDKAKRIEVVDDDEPDEWFVIPAPLLRIRCADLSR